MKDIKRLSDPFETVQCRPVDIRKDGNLTTAIAIWYIDARDVMDRLDEVVGVENWKDEYTILPSGDVVCKLQVRIGGEWVVKCDVGCPSDQEGNEKIKAAFSDALKRAAVKFGIGRYLYSIPPKRYPYGNRRKGWDEVPQLDPRWLPQKEPSKKEVEQNRDYLQAALREMEQAKTIEELKSCYSRWINHIPKEHQELFVAAKNEHKRRLSQQVEEISY